MSTTPRKTVAGAYAEIAELRSEVQTGFAAILALLEPEAPAKPVRKPAPKARKAAKKPAKPVTPTKGVQTRETLSRKAWNRTLTAQARFAGKDGQTGESVYSIVLAHWADAQAMREAGYTPTEAFAEIVSGR